MQNDLFGSEEAPKRKKTETWLITDHACKSCFGRILRRQISPTISEVMCSECGDRSHGNETTLCWCGKSVGPHGEIFQCVKNENRRPELPNYILVKERRIEIKPFEHKPDRRVHCPDTFEQ